MSFQTRHGSTEPIEHVLQEKAFGSKDWVAVDLTNDLEVEIIVEDRYGTTTSNKNTDGTGKLVIANQITDKGKVVYYPDATTWDAEKDPYHIRFCRRMANGKTRSYPRRGQGFRVEVEKK